MRFPVKLSATEWQMMVEVLAEKGAIKPNWKSFIDVKDKTIEFEFEPIWGLIEERYLPLQTVSDNENKDSK